MIQMLDGEAFTNEMQYLEILLNCLKAPLSCDIFCGVELTFREQLMTKTLNGVASGKSCNLIQ
jgi:hypothetical protein